MPAYIAEAPCPLICISTPTITHSDFFIFYFYVLNVLRQLMLHNSCLAEILPCSLQLPFSNAEKGDNKNLVMFLREININFQMQFIKRCEKLNR